MSLRFPLVLALACIAVTACNRGAPQQGQGPGAGQGQGQGAPVAVVSAAVREVDWSDAIEALGTANANESVTLTAKVTETVERVNFDDGDLVDEGKVLVDLSGRAEVAGLEEAQANYTEALKQYRRQAELVEQGTIAKSMLDTLTATRDAAQARMNAIRARLSDRVITAPFAGLLGFRQVSPGTLVTPGTAIATLDDISIIKLDFSVPETHLAALQPGQRIEARSAAYPDHVFEGDVRTIGSRVDPVTRAATVRATISNADAKLRPGMLLTVRLQQAPRRALVIPEIAVIQVGTVQSVYRIGANSTVEQVTVRTGARRRGEVEILEGLAAGERVVAEGIVKVRPGAVVAEAAGQGDGGVADTASAQRAE
jgi:membrane fusion protein (multidrug efflux system)